MRQKERWRMTQIDPREDNMKVEYQEISFICKRTPSNAIYQITSEWEEAAWEVTPWGRSTGGGVEAGGDTPFTSTHRHKQMHKTTENTVIDKTVSARYDDKIKIIMK